MPKIPNTEFTARINATQELLEKVSSNDEVLGVLMKRYQISKRQAYRYILAAQRTSGRLSVPERKVAFTIKLPLSLVTRLRQFASATGESLGALVTQALESFLKRGRHG